MATVRLTRAERREQLLDVAAGLVESKGPDAVTMEGVAAAAGVSKGLGYVYFSNRDDLLLSLLRREMGLIDVRVRAALDGAEGFELRIRAAVGAFLDFIEERGILLGTLLAAPQIEGPLKATRARWTKDVTGFYGELAASELELPREQAEAAAAILIAGLTGVLEWWRQGAPRRLLEDTYSRIVVGGVMALVDEYKGTTTALR